MKILEPTPVNYSNILASLERSGKGVSDDCIPVSMNSLLEEVLQEITVIASGKKEKKSRFSPLPIRHILPQKQGGGGGGGVVTKVELVEKLREQVIRRLRNRAMNKDNH